MEVKKTAEEIRKEAEQNIERIAKEAAVKSLEEKLEGFASQESVNKSVSELEEKLKGQITQKDLDELSAKFKKSMQMRKVEGGDINSPRDAVKALEQSISNGLMETIEKQKGFSSGSLGLIQKAITPASFGSADDYQTLTSFDMGLDRNPYAPVWLRSIFPNVSTSSASINYRQRGAVTGAAAIWKRGTGTAGADESKPEVTPTYVKKTASIDWIAGITNVEREVLDDVDFIRTEIPYTLINSESGILAAENAMIVDYIRNNKTDFSKDADYDIGVEKIIAAAFGQLGSKYLTPTHLLISYWDYLTYVAFNKAGGSGEYDLPGGVRLSFLSDGTMLANNLTVVPVPELNAREAYVVAANRSRFVNRQEIRLSMSEDHADNFVKNMITYRAEERVGFFSYDVNANVKITLPEAAEEEGGGVEG